MHMNAYVERGIEAVRQKHGNEPEFVQTVEEVISSLSPVIDKHPEYEKAALGRKEESFLKDDGKTKELFFQTIA